MEPTATDDQRMLLDSSARFIADVYPLERVRAAAFYDAAARIEYLRQTAELGWYSMLVPERFGGGSVTDNGLTDAALIAAVRGAGLQPAPFVGANVVAHALSVAGTDEQRAQALGGVVSGATTATWVFDDSLTDRAPRGQLRAVRSVAGYEISGAASVVQDGAIADWLLVTTQFDDDLAQFLVPADTAGLSIVGRKSLDISRRFARVEFDRVSVPDSSMVGSATDASHLVATQLAIACVLTAAESVGAMQRDMETALVYSKERIAFGRPIGSFQAIKHLLADTSLDIEMSMAITLAAAEQVGTGDPSASRASTIAKAFVADRGIAVAQQCFQVFGGIGFTWEHDQHLYLRRLTSDAALYGTAEWHREHLCRLSGLDLDG